MPKTAKKLKIGWFSFTCCEDSTIVFTELLNQNYFKWRKFIEFKHVRILKSHNELNDLDIAFVEGAISSPGQAKEVKEIRANCKKLVAIGNCAITANPSGARNSFSPEVLKKFEQVYKTFQYSKKVQRLNEVVTVDDQIPGCPMNGDFFVNKLGDYLVEFKVTNAPNS